MKIKNLSAGIACAALVLASIGCAEKKEGTGVQEAGTQDTQAAESAAAENGMENGTGSDAGANGQQRAESGNGEFVAVIEGDHRTPEYKARDQYRHPAETLEFMGIEPGMTVVEIWPGGGWYTEILAPYLQESGTLYAAHFPAESESGYFQKSRKAFEEKLQGDSDAYGAVKLTEFDPADGSQIAPEGSADAVVTFRNVHNWMSRGNEENAFKSFFAVLKPGGILGVVEHRAKPGTSREDMVKSGYVTQDYVVELAEKAGFELEEASEINANPKDTADHPKGVWTLPPSLRLGDEDREKYQSIGESDRMTLRFRKPAE
ncbi:class I SAM-dependent methyltransferase [Microbulbifer yueqingensis]|uniref:Predicted methyltransferase n=1 Tax=Microbulbifer yueqingensis TaxID=658219 RepID=A0A1G9ATT1_9GAMM|nr:methyltransferase [Microbulbifer yueqingensis]SDK29975.1 Predicted methyltransferase [Microbulbifer yueqingensis]